MTKEWRDLHLPQSRRNGALDDAAQALVIEAFEDVADEPRSSGPDAGALTRGRLQEPSRGTGHVKTLHPPSDHRGDQEIFLEEVGERFADAVLVPWNDCSVRDRQAKRMSE